MKKKIFINTRKFEAMHIAYFCLVITSLIIRLININIPILESFGFRQTQTAITVQTWIHDGVSIFSYSTPVLGFPYMVPFEFPIYQLFAYFINDLFLNNLDLALRITNLIFYYASVWLLYNVCKQLISNKISILIIVAVYLLNPFSIFWSRTSMIDFCSVAFGLAYLLMTLKWINKQSIKLLIFSIITGSLAYLTKVTSMFPIVVILYVYLIMVEFNFIYNKVDITIFRKIVTHIKNNIIRYLQLLLIILVPVLIGFLWVKYTDIVKINNGQDWLSSSALKSWNYGTLEQKLSFANWGVISTRIFRHMFPYVNTIYLFSIIFTATFLKKDERKLASFSILAVTLTVFILFNLYYVHDYYMIAIVPYLSIVVGINIHYIFKTLVQNKQFILIIFLISTSIISYIKTPDYFDIIKDKEILTYENNATVQLGRYIENITNYDENVIITDADWSSEILYYSNRKGLMLRKDMQIDESQNKNNDFKFIVSKNPNNYPMLFSSFKDVVFIEEVSGFKVFSVGGGKEYSKEAGFINTESSESVKGYIDFAKLNEYGFNNEINIIGWAFLDNEDVSNQDIFLQVTNDDGTTKFYQTNEMERKDVSKFFQDDNLNQTGFSCSIDYSTFTSVPYKINIIVKNDNKFFMFKNDFFIK